MQSVRLLPEDDRIRLPGPEHNWNESRYLDFLDPVQDVAGWLRLGNRPNEGHAERSVCVHLPDGRAAFGFARSPITGNTDEVGGLVWGVERPFVLSSVRFDGDLSLLDDPRALTNPKVALSGAPKVSCHIDLTVHADGLAAVLGQEQWQIGKIFLPGQADGHYQHLVRVRGTVRVCSQTWSIDGFGGRDHSWGPRNWHSKRHFRWMVGSGANGFGFMLTVSASETERRRAGCVVVDGRFLWTEDIDLSCDYNSDHLAQRVCIVVRAEGRAWRIEGEPVSHLPLRHRRKDAQGDESVLRILKSPMHWRVEDAGEAWGIAEIHDRLESGVPVDRSV